MSVTKVKPILNEALYQNYPINRHALVPISNDWLDRLWQDIRSKVEPPNIPKPTETPITKARQRAFYSQD
jgi:hypothetical protein